MTCFVATVTPAQLLGAAAVILALGALLVLSAVALEIVTSPTWPWAWPPPAPPGPPEPPEHQCPYCGRMLRAVTVIDPDEPKSADAAWYCSWPSCRGTWFRDRPAGKPDPLPEEV